MVSIASHEGVTSYHLLHFRSSCSYYYFGVGYGEGQSQLVYMGCEVPSTPQNNVINFSCITFCYTS